MTNFTINRDGNKIAFCGAFDIDNLYKPLAAVHQAIERASYSDIIFDFSNCAAAYPSAMLALCAQAAKLRHAQIDIELILPSQIKLRRLFENANWAHIISPKQYDPSAFRGHTQVPATQYKSADEQFKAVNRIANAILGAIPDLERSDFAALEWAINELTDNVLVHSGSAVGGFVQVSTFASGKKKVLFMVADAGVGIPKTLKEGFPEINSDADALDRAIREGVTRNRSIGQGNGLFGSYEICSKCGGGFQLESGHARLIYDERQGLHIRTEKVPYEGTLVIAEVDFSIPHLLEEALSFDGKKHNPLDHIEKFYESHASDDLIFSIEREAKSYGSRIAGTPLRHKLINLAKMCPGQIVRVDFSGVELISSSFADELIAKLFIEIGPVEFMSRFKLISVSSTVQSLIDRAIKQRIDLS
ncbi:STAS-like domain-containing protein [Chromobacterium violaceum]|uniref:STAS-like domain-containing protein n=1 Tax=Chromobacterium violaceum TaxID=536 RepID=UPI0009BBA653|nr:DUF4325 domain-containing protein [Chromobacterium violaceum]